MNTNRHFKLSKIKGITLKQFVKTHLDFLFGIENLQINHQLRQIILQNECLSFNSLVNYIHKRLQNGIFKAPGLVPIKFCFPFFATFSTGHIEGNS